MIRALALIILAFLGGCSAYTVDEARSRVVGMNAPDLISCAGIPDKMMKISSDEMLIQYDRPAGTASVFSVKVLGLADVAVGRPGACHAQFRILRDGVVSGASFSGTSFSLSGPQGDCAPIVRECVTHPDRTALPGHYDAFAIFLKDAKHGTP